MNRIPLPNPHPWRLLDAQGRVEHDDPLLQSRELLLTMQRALRRTCRVDERAIALQRTGQLGTYPSCRGMEAISVGSGLALAAEDRFAPYYRDLGTQLVRGVRIVELLQFWGGDERGSDFQHPQARRDLANCVPIATQVTHAAGMATALKIRGEAHAVLASCGDGATSRGDFYEALNVAGVWRLPLVVVVNNNGWAISVPLGLQTASETLAAKAVAVGIPGVVVDGCDVVAVYQQVSQALARARQGQGATLIEARAPRLADHTTADDGRRYRPAAEWELAWHRDPLPRLERYLRWRGWWDDAQAAAWEAQLDQELQQAVAQWQAIPAAPATAMFEHLYAQLPEALAGQYRQLQTKGVDDEP